MTEVFCDKAAAKRGEEETACETKTKNSGARLEENLLYAKLPKKAYSDILNALRLPGPPGLPDHLVRVIRGATII